MGFLTAQTSWTTRAYPSHYRFALTRTDLHIHPDIPGPDYLPGPSGVDRMIVAGERATNRALEHLSKKMVA